MKKLFAGLALAVGLVALSACGPLTEQQKEAVECQKNPSTPGCPAKSTD